MRHDLSDDQENEVDDIEIKSPAAEAYARRMSPFAIAERERQRQLVWDAIQAGNEGDMLAEPIVLAIAGMQERPVADSLRARPC